VASVFVLFIGTAIAELASAAPTSGGVRMILNFTVYLILNPKLKALFLDLFIGFSTMEKCFMLARRMYAVRASPCKRTDFYLPDANTIGLIACVASVDWGCAVQIMATVTIGSGGSYEPTSAQLL
jgi:amino acid transporter